MEVWVQAIPEFKDLDLSATEHKFGCSFCTWHRGPTSDMETDVGGIAIEQLDAAERLEQMARTAHAEGFPDIASWFESISDAKRARVARLQDGLSQTKEAQAWATTQAASQSSVAWRRSATGLPCTWARPVRRVCTT